MRAADRHGPALSDAQRAPDAAAEDLQRLHRARAAAPARGGADENETIYDLVQRWQEISGGDRAPDPPADAGGGETKPTDSSSSDPTQPTGGWTSSGSYTDEGFKQVGFSYSDGTTIEAWVGPDKTPTVTETQTADGYTFTQVQDEYGNQIYSSVTDPEGNTTSTTDGVGTTRCDQSDAGCGDETTTDPEDPSSCEESDPSCGDGSTGTAYVGPDDANGGTPTPVPAGFGPPATGLQLAPPPIVQLGDPTNDGGDDNSGGPVREPNHVVDPAPDTVTASGGPAPAAPTISPMPPNTAGPEFGADGPTAVEPGYHATRM